MRDSILHSVRLGCVTPGATRFAASFPRTEPAGAERAAIPVMPEPDSACRCQERHCIRRVPGGED